MPACKKRPTCIDTENPFKIFAITNAEKLNSEQNFDGKIIMQAGKNSTNFLRQSSKNIKK